MTDEKSDGPNTPETASAPVAFSVVTPVFDPPLDMLRATIDSVLAQTHPHWELVLVDDASTNPEVVGVLHDYAARDPRIRVIEREVNGHIVAASNDGVAAARHEFLALLDHDDRLRPEALARMAYAIERNPNVDYLYSDETTMTREGRPMGTFHKPRWSPERLRAQMYTCHLSVLRTSLVRAVGGFHEGFQGSQDHDLVLRVTERARSVVHVPETLYEWWAAPGSVVGDANAKPYAWEAGRRAVQEHLNRQGLVARAELGSESGTYRVVRTLDPSRLVSVVIPTAGASGRVWGRQRCFVIEAVRSLLARGGHEHLEIVVVYDGQMPAAVLAELRVLAGERLVEVESTAPFNFSERCNLGVAASHGEVVVLLNDDVELISHDFLVQLVAPLFEPGVVLTGPKLRFADSSIQHAGLVFFAGGPGHAFHGAAPLWPGPSGALVVSRECSGLTGACLAVRRVTYDDLGGMCEDLPLSYNDVDFSYKARRLGRLLWIEHAEAFHFESKSRDPLVQPWERDLLLTRWRPQPVDPYLPQYGTVRE